MTRDEVHCSLHHFQASPYFVELCLGVAMGTGPPRGQHGENHQKPGLKSQTVLWRSFWMAIAAWIFSNVVVNPFFLKKTKTYFFHNNMTMNGRWESCPNGRFIMWLTALYDTMLNHGKCQKVRTKGGAGLQDKSTPVIWSGLWLHLYERIGHVYLQAQNI